MPDLELLDHFCTQDVDQFPNKTEDILKKKTTYNCIIVYIHTIQYTTWNWVVQKTIILILDY